MKPIKALCLAILVPFTGLTVYALAQVGYLGIFSAPLASPGGWQVFADLVIALLLVMVWMVRDASRRGRNVWPYVVVTLLAGSFGPLLYLLLAPASDAAGAQD